MVAVCCGDSGPGFAQDGRQGAPVDEFHDDEVRAVVLAPVEDRDDVRMREVGGRLRLATEPLHERTVDRELGEEHLQGHRAVQLAIPRPVDLRHTPTRDEMRQLVAI